MFNQCLILIVNIWKKKIINKNNKIFSIVDRNFIISILNDPERAKKYSKFIFSFINAAIFLKNNWTNDI